MDLVQVRLEQQRVEIKERMHLIQKQIIESKEMQKETSQKLEELKDSQVARYAVKLAQEELAVNAEVIEKLEESQKRMSSVLKEYEERKEVLSELLERTQALISEELSQTVIEKTSPEELKHLDEEQVNEQDY